MFGAELVIVLLAIYLGARLGGIGIGFAGGLGVLVLTLIFQIKPGAIPFDVIEIIMAVIAAIAAMQGAGGMDYLVSLAERMLRRHPKYITFLAPLVTWFMTILAGTGHTAFSTLPVITEVAKEQGIRPSRPLSIAVVASQIAITASPISAAVVFFAGILEPMGVSYLTLLAIGAVTTATEWDRIQAPAWQKVMYTFSFPLFMFTYIPISFAALFMKVEWKPIRHGAAARLPANLMKN